MMIESIVQDEETHPEEKIRFFFDQNVLWYVPSTIVLLVVSLLKFSPEAASNNHSVKGAGSELMSSFDDSESSGSKQSRNSKGESFWSGHLCQSANNCSGVFTSNDHIVLNVSDVVLETVESFLTEQNFCKDSSSIKNNLCCDGDIVYTEMKVKENLNMQ